MSRGRKVRGEFRQKNVSFLLFFRCSLDIELGIDISYSWCSSSSSSCSRGALAVVLWYHTRLISERLPVRIPAGRTKNLLTFSTLPLLPHRLMSYFDVWRHLSFRENPHRTQDSIAATRQQLDQPMWRTMALPLVYWRGADRGDQVVP